MRFVRILLIGLVLSGLLVGGYWYFRVRPRLRSINRDYDAPKITKPITAELLAHPGKDFDLSLDLPGDPSGLVATRAEYLIGNRADPWGFLRLRRVDSTHFEVRKLAVIEDEYGQKLSFNNVTWNGKEYVGLTALAWFRKGD